MKHRCYFCRFRKEFIAKISWKGRWRKACPTCQIRYAQGTLRDRRS